MAGQSNFSLVHKQQLYRHGINKFHSSRNTRSLHVIQKKFIWWDKSPGQAVTGQVKNQNIATNIHFYQIQSGKTRKAPINLPFELLSIRKIIYFYLCFGECLAVLNFKHHSFQAYLYQAILLKLSKLTAV